MDKIREFFSYFNPYKVHNLECFIPNQLPRASHIPDRHPLSLDLNPNLIVPRPVTIEQSPLFIAVSGTCYPSVAKCVDGIGLDYSIVNIPEFEERSRTVDLVRMFSYECRNLDQFADKSVEYMKKLVERLNVFVDEAKCRREILSAQAFQGIPMSDFQFFSVKVALGLFRDEIIMENRNAMARYNLARLGKNISFGLAIVATIILFGLQLASSLSPWVKAAVCIFLAMLGAFPFAAFGFVNSFANVLMKYLSKDIKVLSEIEISVKILCEHTKQIDRLIDGVHRLKFDLDAINGTTPDSSESVSDVLEYLYEMIFILKEWISWFDNLKTMKKVMKTEILKAPQK